MDMELIYVSLDAIVSMIEGAIELDNLNKPEVVDALAVSIIDSANIIRKEAANGGGD